MYHSRAELRDLRPEGLEISQGMKAIGGLSLRMRPDCAVTSVFASPGFKDCAQGDMHDHLDAQVA